MENVVDFLRRCTSHGIYAVAILDETPHNAYYDGITARRDHKLPFRRVTGYNRQYLTQGLIDAKAAAIADFISYIKAADPGLLHAVLGWSFANEIFVNFTEGPFNRDDGKVATANGRIYNMADKDQRQACYDEGVVYWANRLAEAVRSVDPEALVTAGMWTADAHGRLPYNGVLPDEGDPRIPPRPSALSSEACNLDFLDIHIYPWGGSSKVQSDAHEQTAVLATGTPVIVGEYGAFKDKPIDQARAVLAEMLEQAFDMGYSGSLFWIWDLSMVPGQTWSAVEKGLAAYVMSLQPEP